MTIWRPKLDPDAKPLYAAIVQALIDDTTQGRLSEGDRLPTHRQLSGTLGLSLGTVTRAYKEAERRGIIRGVVGRGTFVGSAVARQNPLAPVDPSYPQVIDLGVSWPIYSEDPDLAGTLRKIAARPDVRRLTRYQPNRGMTRHRAAGAEWMRRLGFAADPEEVLVCVGTQHALTVSLAVLLQPGDTLLTESLTYPGAKAVAELLGIRLHGLAMDREGLLPDAFASACRQQRGKVLYCVPSVHNPTTGTMSEQRRRDIAAVARKYGIAVIEDAVHHRLTADEVPPIASFAPERTFLLAGLAKAVCGGLRVAFLRAPAPFREHLARSIWATTWLAPPLTVEVAATWIEDGTAEETVRRKRGEAAARLEIVRDVLGDLPFRAAPHGFHIWLALPERWHSAAFAADTFRRGVAVTTVDAFAVGEHPPEEGVRICTSAAENRAALRRGLHLVRDAWSGTPGLGSAIL
ncbi:MAG: PLP-dependent aminotransferase family protein [Gemmatimonadetes bacterium]|nr:PLP-dependent aminotransferase family protein [Gemmatimonadota bacterium]